MDRWNEWEKKVHIGEYSSKLVEKLNFAPSLLKKGIYFDGHERSDVVSFRRDIFLPRMLEFETFMIEYSGPTMEDEIQAEGLRTGGRRHQLVVHDESIFYSYEANSMVWLREIGEGMRGIIRKKGKGRAIHVSAFRTDSIGVLRVSQEAADRLNLPRLEATETIIPGVNNEGWWTAERLLSQLVVAITMFEESHPDMVGTFLFDNSTCHGALSEGALVASRTNVGPGGKQSRMNPTRWESSAGVWHEQDMVYPPNHETMPGQAKGMKAVLQERGLVATLSSSE